MTGVGAVSSVISIVTEVDLLGSIFDVALIRA